MRYTIALSLASLLTSTAALAEVPRVVTDVPPVHSLVAMVLGDLGEPGLVMDRGGNAHDLQLRPSQAAMIAEAQLAIWAGAAMAPWMDRALTGLGADVPRLTLLETEGTRLRDFGAAQDAEPGHDGHDHGEHDHDAEHEGHDHDHAHDDHDHDHAGEPGHDHDHAHEDHAGHDHSGHSHDGIDPHAWLDPHNAGHWLGLIAAELSRLDPDNAATYAANATAGADRIATLEAEIAATLAPVQDRPFVVFHDAYGYFAHEFGLNVAGAVRLGDASSPGAARLRELRAGLEGGFALCAFPEAGHDPALLEQMAEGTGVRIGGLLDPAGAALTPGPMLYEDLMRGLATTITDCLTRG
ncbi:zinc ABC transporter substrate-binding protein [Szabonella alba]|uniref:High-affinity zinc uptake system protein ZnuA n=1 Tax=Szabonella alba TaxID=2804194 RepID=A0A8K0Y0F5_9RHOB|nr:zinc ABC transporter substrate-binding protein [Szabonella alba]MBL4918135.1 zinc ABC transporter substrate-binding protein [Szabonella alba]